MRIFGVNPYIKLKKTFEQKLNGQSCDVELGHLMIEFTSGVCFIADLWFTFGRLPCIYSHAMKELQYTVRVFDATSMWRLSSANNSLCLWSLSYLYCHNIVYIYLKCQTKKRKKKNAPSVV